MKDFCVIVIVINYLSICSGNRHFNRLLLYCNRIHDYFYDDKAACRLFRETGVGLAIHVCRKKMIFYFSGQVHIIRNIKVKLAGRPSLASFRIAHVPVKVVD